MKHLRVVRLLPWLLISLCPPLLGHCGGALEHSTETGNPPVVEQQKLHVVLHDDGVEVVGDAGAVTPAATVTVTNTRSGDHAQTIANADGSLKVSVPGELADEYEVTVSSGGGSQTVRVAASSSEATNTNTSSDANLSDAELASASCDALGATLEQRVSTAYGSTDNPCASDEDCKYYEWSGACYTDCGRSVLSHDTFLRVEGQLNDSLEPLCSEIGKRCAPHNRRECEPLDAVPQCLDGSCQALDLSSYSCEDISNTVAQRADALITGVNRDCRQDADCVLYEQPVSCVSTCSGHPTAVAVSAVNALDNHIGYVEYFCNVFRARPCAGPARLPCPAPLMQPKAVCIPPSLGGPDTPGRCEVSSTQP